MDKLEWAVDTVDGTTFERIAGEILRNEGYDVHESGVIGTGLTNATSACSIRSDRGRSSTVTS